jgi:hypothetical protein
MGIYSRKLSLSPMPRQPGKSPMNLSNIRFHAPGCPSPALKPKSKYLHQDLETFIGKYVKLRFVSQDGRNEYMWVLVKSVDGDKLKGNLNQDPILCHHLKDGDEVVLGRNEIIDTFVN